MALTRLIKQHVSRCVLGMIMLIPVYGAMPIEYKSPMGDEAWKVSGNRLRCGLSITIPEYGIGYFEQYAARPPHFILDKWQKVEETTPIVLMNLPPVWRAGLSPVLVTKNNLSTGEFSLYLTRDVTLKMLNLLNQGHVASFQYISEEGNPVKVMLSPIKFKAMYATYVRCVGKLLPFDFESVEKTVFHFGIEGDDVAEEDRDQLQRIAEYSKADPNVKYIEVAGYTDDSGRKSINNAISEYRAKAVSQYLMDHGVNEKLLKITWFGPKNPLMSNETDEGRQANRRVEVTIHIK